MSSLIKPDVFAGAPAGASHPLRVIASAEVRMGDIGVMSPSGRNHHFVVIGRSGGKLDTVEPMGTRIQWRAWEQAV